MGEKKSLEVSWTEACAGEVAAFNVQLVFPRHMCRCDRVSTRCHRSGAYKKRYTAEHASVSACVVVACITLVLQASRFVEHHESIHVACVRGGALIPGAFLCFWACASTRNVKRAVVDVES